MKKFMINTFATTGIFLIMLSFVALAFHAKCIYLETVFQIFVVNVLSHLLIILIRKMDFRSNCLEMTLELISLESELLIFGWLFHWFTSVSVAILVIMGGGWYMSYHYFLIYYRWSKRQRKSILWFKSGGCNKSSSLAISI